MDPLRHLELGVAKGDFEVCGFPIREGDMVAASPAISNRIAADFPAALWEKFLFIASFGGVGAITRSGAGALRTIPETRRLLEELMRRLGPPPEPD